MKPYSEYKDSGVKWIGEIPGHWECRKLKFLTSSMQSGDNLTAIQIKEIGKYPVYGGNGIRGYYDDSNCNKQCIVIGRQGALCGNVHIVKKPFWATDHAVVTYANENTDLDFLFYLTKAMNLNQYASQTAAQPGIAVSAIKNIYTCYPPLPEQEAIVTYLDSKVAKIDEYISIAEKKIAALEELKQTIIAEAVTRGIHKDVPMKDSGVKWIGMIPEHWKRLRYKDVLRIRDEKVGKRKDLTLLSLSKKGVIIRDLIDGKGKFPKDFESYKIVTPNNLILCLFDVDETPRTVGIAKNTGMITGAYDIFDVINENIKFIYYHYQSIDDVKGFKPLYKGLRKVIPLPSLMGSYIFIPSLEEQQEIVTYIEAKVANINQLCQAERSQIEKLKEYKQRLISDVVTGKVKVTND